MEPVGFVLKPRRDLDWVAYARQGMLAGSQLGCW
jgi:hypothetical protein